MIKTIQDLKNVRARNKSKLLKHYIHERCLKAGSFASEIILTGSKFSTLDTLKINHKDLKNNKI